MHDKLHAVLFPTLSAPFCAPITGNAARPIVQELIGKIPAQTELNKTGNPAGVKLVVDPYLRVIGE